ncbi:lipopolysaccharide biosynthesis protein [Pseudonocardia endophytica]|uniref:O-antigen/teichoic acid export membrane protein n=1 Tax=Pseudonocardia endophytica TaxID=401976 RepID=A0A4R1HMP0_PSEEN|nr:lipopolysaccharide biosynthesis protein [Pseudonocardia endophytica]TCK20929.1 O-antigen/teichoic acid export membrane protein [Pseudonocardia endophytica]
MTSDRSAAKASLGGQAVSIAIGLGASQLLTAVIFVAAARASSPQNFGVVAAAVSLGLVVAGVVDFGTSNMWVRDLANGNSHIGEVSARATGKICICVLIFGVSGLVTIAGGVDWRYLAACPIGISFLLKQTADVGLRAGSRGHHYAISGLIDKATAFALFLTLLALEAPADLAMCIALSAGPIFGGAFSWIVTSPSLRVTPRSSFLKFWPWRRALGYGSYSSAISLQNLDVSLLALFGGPQSAGLYGAVTRWTQPMGMVSTAVSSASIPYIAKAPSNAAAIAQVRRTYWILGLAILACVCVASFAPVLVPLLVGDAYSGSVGILQILALGTIPAVLNQPMAVFLQARHFDRFVSVVIGIGVGVQLTSLIGLIPLMGALSAAVAFLLAQIVIFSGFSAKFARLRRQMM